MTSLSPPVSTEQDRETKIEILPPNSRGRGNILKSQIFSDRFLSRGKRDLPCQNDPFIYGAHTLQYFEKGGNKYGAVAAVVSGEAGGKNAQRIEEE